MSFQISNQTLSDGNCPQFLADKLFGRGGSESVPDTRQVVTENKLRVLRRQVNSLTQFQSKLEKELEALEEKHEGRKRRFESSIATFEVEMKKHAGKTVVVDQDMIDKQVCSLLMSFSLDATWGADFVSQSYLVLHSAK